MIRRLLSLLLLAAAPSPGGRAVLGVYGRWGAVRWGAPPRCVALSEPITAHRGGAPAIAFTMARGLRPQLHLTLSRPAASAEAIVGAARFRLLVRGQDGWAIDARADAAIVRAARAAEGLAVRAVDAHGRHFRDLYPLAGFPSALDAAAAGCLAR